MRPNCPQASAIHYHQEEPSFGDRNDLSFTIYSQPFLLVYAAMSERQNFGITELMTFSNSKQNLHEFYSFD